MYNQLLRSIHKFVNIIGCLILCSHLLSFSHFWPMADRVRISKKLSYLLRHNALKQGLPIDEEGYVPVSTILSVPQLKGVSFATIQEIVNDDPKRRFKLVKTDEDWIIRCNQGKYLRLKQRSFN